MIEHKLRMGDTDVHCIESDNEDERIFILLHGAHFNSEIWTKVNTLKLLETHGISFIAPDIPGFGLTQKSKIYSEASGLNRFILDLCTHKSAKSLVLIASSNVNMLAAPLLSEHL